MVRTVEIARLIIKLKNILKMYINETTIIKESIQDIIVFLANSISVNLNIKDKGCLNLVALVFPQYCVLYQL